MNFYSKSAIDNFSKEQFHFLEIAENENILSITLNRPDKRNSLHPQMVHELAFAMQYAHDSAGIRLVVIAANGPVFCAGADLKAMSGDVEEHSSTIPAPEKEVLIGEIFNKVHKPTIAKVEGNVYAGGFLILAGCTYVVAADTLSFSLPEVKRGLFPMQVMASLLRVMPPRKVIDWCIRGFSITAEQATELGLVTHLSKAEAIDTTIEMLISEIRENSPTAIHLGLEAFDTLLEAESQHEYLKKMLQKTINSEDFKEGMIAFKEKRKPNWRN